jgi:hypothetical protein
MKVSENLPTHSLRVIWREEAILYNYGREEQGERTRDMSGSRASSSV